MVNNISDSIWFFTTFFIIYAGIYYTVKLKFPQFRLIKIISSLKNKKGNNAFHILNLTLAGKIGVGSISGIALCIFKGGIGSIFWLWISALILASLTYVETKLGTKYRTSTNNGFIGGPSLYIENGLKKQTLAKIYSILIILTYIVAFISIQSNTIVISVQNSFHLNKAVIVLILSIITFLSIYKGINTISKITNFLVPIMGSLYILIGIIIIINNFDASLNLLKEIVGCALSKDGLKKSILIPIIIGIERGIFSNEAGIGTTAMISSLSNETNSDSLASLQIVGTFFTSLIICTITALIILTSNYQNFLTANMNGIELVSMSLNEHFGTMGSNILTIIIFLFAFSTIVTSYYYGELNLKYLFKSNNLDTLLKIIVIIIIVYSSFTSPSLLWNIVDIFVALISIINIYAILKLKKDDSLRSKK